MDKTKMKVAKRLTEATGCMNVDSYKATSYSGYTTLTLSFSLQRGQVRRMRNLMRERCMRLAREGHRFITNGQAFSMFVESKQCPVVDGEITEPSAQEVKPRKNNKGTTWKCCNTEYMETQEIHKHVSHCHKYEVDIICKDILTNGTPDARWSALRTKRDNQSESNEAKHDEQYLLPKVFSEQDVFPWLPSVAVREQEVASGELRDRILLFYTYRDIENTAHVKEWQKTLCERLSLTGKIRVAGEGINGTVGGSWKHTQLYITSVCSHPLFCHMTTEDFKESEGRASDFPGGLKVGVFAEIVPMGVDPDRVSYRAAGEHLTPEEFHKRINQYLQAMPAEQQKSVIVDCRNFYESKIGKFTGAMAPDIRKFSYWPEYVDQNLDLFRDKDVYMYCTGGIRCERGSAYLRSKGVCDNVYQLQGGIHKYIEQFPNGHFRGKLFVFDDRYAIKANEEVISECRYCSTPYDEYEPCSSQHCHQLVLSCEQCRSRGHTACCPTCQESEQGKEECECTNHRLRVPFDVLQSYRAAQDL